jgi:nitrate/TMAO reductase-like tetraheme cytochrome c subunit
VAGSAILIVFSLALSLLMKQGSPYIGILTYLVFPIFLVLGALIFVYGIRREIARRRKLGVEEALPYPTLDLNQPSQRRKFTYALLAGFALLLLLSVVSYHAFIFTESVTFCGRVCHTVMEPEYTAYLASPHARVRCVDCHVGSGASWYVKSKLSGARQVIAVTFHTYPTPIGVPVRNLRPARETCEECHWPQKFYGAQLIQNPHFRYDEANSPEQISLLVKTGGGSTKLGQNAGIHWHMIIQNKIEYVAIDEQLQQIPWIMATGPDGKRREYVSKDAVPAPEKLAAMRRHTMDCMDCHNRPTHIYQPPEGAVDRAMASGLIAPTLPWIKKVAVDALVREYPTRDAAHAGIRGEIMAFYEKQYPSVRTGRAADLDDTVRRITEIYDRSVFPEMKVNWKTYASNIGHRNWPGCFRCHDGKHVSADGQTLSKECTTCHTMPQRGPLSPIGTAMPASDQNWHPWELKSKHAQILCNRCHAAGYRPPTACADCHKLDAKAPMMDGGCDNCHAAEQQVKPLNDCKACHEKLPELHAKGGHPDAACTDCHKPHGWKVTGRDTCIACHDDKKAHYPDGGDCATCHEFKAPAAKSAHLEPAVAASHGARRASLPREPGGETPGPGASWRRWTA